MKYFKPFSDWSQHRDDFNLDLFKVYITVDPESNQKYINYKEFATDKFFNKIDNIDQINRIDPFAPILNYDSRITRDLISKFRIDDSRIYNHPDLIIQSGSKVIFHQRVGDHPNVPKTVFTQKDALGLKFPVVAKPSKKHSGIGLQVFNKSSELKKSNPSDFDLYSEWVDKKEEHRIITFKGKSILWMQRHPLNDKASTGKGDKDSEMNFKYTKILGVLPDNITSVLSEFCGMFSELPYICFDLMVDQQDKAWIIESNVMPGVPFDVMVNLYQEIFKDWYGRDVNSATLNKLDQLAKELDQKTLLSDTMRFDIKKI